MSRIAALVQQAQGSRAPSERFIDRFAKVYTPLVIVVALLLMVVPATGGLAALCWTALKVGALSYGGGFVIIPLMQADAVDRYGWMTNGEFLDAVALGQATPGPVVQTVAVVGYAAHGLGGALLAALVAFAPSFWFIALGAERFDRLRTQPDARAFLDGAGPAAIGAILGSAVPLALATTETWQIALLAAGAVLLLVLRRGVVSTLLLAGAARRHDRARRRTAADLNDPARRSRPIRTAI